MYDTLCAMSVYSVDVRWVRGTGRDGWAPGATFLQRIKCKSDEKSAEALGDARVTRGCAAGICVRTLTGMASRPVGGSGSEAMSPSVRDASLFASPMCVGVLR